jgi:hypothetical protein
MYKATMQYRFESLLYLFLVTAGLLSVTGCSKPSELGLSLVETNPSEIFYTDTVSMQLSTVLTRPLLTDSRSRWLCGAYVDPVFGKTTASLYTNFRLTTTNASFPGAQFDSLVLTIQYDTLGHYGGNPSTFTQQNWEVYRITESIVPEQDYYSDKNFTEGDLLATHSFVPQIFDSVSVQGVMRRPHMRIRLDDALGQELLSPSTNIYENNTIFKDFLKGVCVKPKAGSSNSAIIRFFPNASLTKLTLFYRDSSNVSRTYDYLSDADSESVLAFEQNYNGTRVLENNPSDTIVYLQGMNGVSARLEFPFLEDLGDVIVNKAELYIYPVGEEDRTYPIPNQLFCLEKTSDDNYLLIDDISNSINRNNLNPYLIFGGTLKYDGERPYFRMNLSKFFQRLVDNETAEKAVYIQTASVTEAGRMLLANEKSENLRAKLYLTYTKTNQ